MGLDMALPCRSFSLFFLLIQSCLSSCFFCSGFSRDSISESPARRSSTYRNEFKSELSGLVDEGSTLERSEYGSSRRKRSKNASSWEREEEFRLCNYFDSRLYSQADGKYLPAIPTSRILGGACSKEDFVVSSLIGKGTFGRVFKGTHVPSGRTVALKHVPYDLADDIGLSEIRQEECLQNRMAYFKPVVQHYCTYIRKTRRKGHQVVLVLEYVLGDELFSVIHDRQKASKWSNYNHDNMLTWTGQLILIVRELHRRSVVIMDLKPENLLVDVRGNLRLLDFGLAGDPRRPSRYQIGRRLGTPMYTPPEFIPDSDSESDSDEDVAGLLSRVDHHQWAVDWYCLGLTLYEILFQQPPFNQNERTTEEELFRRIKLGLRPANLWTPEERMMAELIEGFCEAVPEERLGVREGSDEFLEYHPFFEGLSLEAFQILYNNLN